VLVENKEARENLQAILRGTGPVGMLSVADAKARLRSTDPGLDVGRPLRYLNKGEVDKAGFAFVVEIATTITLPYVQPMMKMALFGLRGWLLGKTKK
jgi:hypothetical protein